jgi:hypothetical protein
MIFAHFMWKNRRLRWEGNVGCMDQIRKSYSVLVGKPERNKILGRPRSRC